MEDGLPHTIVQAILQARDGYLWVGTREGLARFDGVRFTSFKFPEETPQPSINSLCEAQDNSLWIATQTAGLFRWQEGKLFHYGRAEGLKGNSVTAVQADSDGSVWIGSPEGVARFHNGKIQIIKDLGNNVRSLFVDNEGTLWVASGQGLKCFKDHKVTTYTTTNGLLANSIKSVYRGKNGVLWVGASAGLTRIQDGVFTQYPKGFEPSGIINTVFEDQEGNIWVGTYAGFSHFANGRFTDQDGDTSYKVYSIMQDSEGSIWVGSEEGLRCLIPKRFNTYTRKQGLSHDKIASVCEGKEGSIWLGTWGGGVDELKDGKVTIYTKTNGLASDYVYSVRAARDGSLWIGLDFYDGLDRIKAGRFTHFGKQQGLIDDAVTVIHEDAQSNIWVGTRGALYRLADTNLIRLDAKDGLMHSRINAICERNEGGLWIGTGGGLTLWNGNKFTDLNEKGNSFTDTVISLYEDADGTLWAGAQGKGLKRFCEGKFYAYTTKNGLLSDVIYAILEDDRANLWMSSSKGIFEVAKSDLNEMAAGKISRVRSVAYDRSDGIVSSSQSTEITQPAGWKGSDGRLWFRTMEGVIVTDPNRIKKNALPPPVVIEEILADKKRIVDVREISNDPIFVPFASPAQFRIPPGRGELEINFTALSFRVPEKNRFKYKLAGVDPDWVDAGTRHFAHYNHIPPSRYTFRVSACNNDGVWSEAGATVVLAFQPHFWQTGWFLTFCAIAMTGLIGGGARYVTERRLQRKLELLERQHAVEEERARIARDMHDDLGSSLANIVLMGEQLERENGLSVNVKSQSRSITGKVQQAIRVMDQIVWAVNPQNDSLPDLVNYLSDYAQSFLQPTSARCRLEIADDLPAIPLTANKRHDLFLAVKEALHNAARHAGATEVSLRIQCVAGALCVMVEDNGQGFDPNIAVAPGNGLRNMRSRLADIGGHADILSQPGKGTIVRFALPVGLAEKASHGHN